MTQALHELLDNKHESIDDPELLNSLNEEFRKTVLELSLHTAGSEAITDVEHASERIKRGLGALGLHEMFALMDAAALSGDSRVDLLAQDAIMARFPTENTGSAAFEEANIRSQLEWKKALDMTKDAGGKKPFSQSLVEAGAITDTSLNDDFDNIIIRSNENVKDQRSRQKAYEDLLKEQKDRRLKEELRREQERQKLSESGGTDDTIPFNPFDDDD